MNVIELPLVLERYGSKRELRGAMQGARRPRGTRRLRRFADIRQNLRDRLVG